MNRLFWGVESFDDDISDRHVSSVTNLDGRFNDVSSFKIKGPYS